INSQDIIENIKEKNRKNIFIVCYENYLNKFTKYNFKTMDISYNIIAEYHHLINFNSCEKIIISNSNISNMSLKYLAKFRKIDLSYSAYITDEGLKYLTNCEELNVQCC